MNDNTTSLHKLLDNLKSSLMAEDAVRLIYLLKAWKVLSEENKISDLSLTFEAFYNSEISIKKLKPILEKLAKDHRVFKLYTPFANVRYKISDDILVMILNVIHHGDEFIEVGEMFSSPIGRGYNYMISMQVTELGVKLLGNDCTDIYSPFSLSQNLTYFTKNKVYAESFADEFMVEASKIIDHQDIEFHYGDALENPSYVNPDASHLLKKFDCTLSFPPMGEKVKGDFYKNDTFNRFKIYRGRGHRDVPYFEHILSHTQNKAVVLMSVGFCYRAGVEQDFRKYLIENNLLEAVIQLPPNLHIGTPIETTFFIVNKNKSDENIQFINLNEELFLEKNKRKIVFNDLDQITQIYFEQKEIENISVIVPNSSVAENSYSLSIDRYVLSIEAAQLKKTLEIFSMLELQEIAEIRRSQMFKEEEQGLEVIEFSPSDMADAGYTSVSKKSKMIGSQENKLNTYELHSNDILLSTKGTIGKVGIVGQLTKPAIASQAMQVIRLNENSPLDPIVLYMYLKSNIGQALLKQLVAGTAMPQVATREIKEFKVPILSESENSRIIQSFKDEMKLYEDIEEKKIKINKIHSNFLGEN